VDGPATFDLDDLRFNESATAFLFEGAKRAAMPSSSCDPAPCWSYRQRRLTDSATSGRRRSSSYRSTSPACQTFIGVEPA